jgi:hypothetical protein
LFSFCLFAQKDSILIKQYQIPKEIKEVSGIIVINDYLILHNDGGNANKIFAWDYKQNILLTKRISNAQNIDWEDISQDRQNIYLADIGNNYGGRTNLGIYSINKEDFFTTSDTVLADFISISYSDQKQMYSDNRNHNFDGESLTKVKDEWWLFSKNWKNNKTKIYRLPEKEVKDTNLLIPMKQFDCRGLITGSTYWGKKGWFVLSGYVDFHPFILFYNPVNNRFFKVYLDDYISFMAQIEGIAITDDTLLITEEEVSFSKFGFGFHQEAKLSCFSLSKILERYPIEKKLNP